MSGTVWSPIICPDCGKRVQGLRGIAWHMYTIHNKNFFEIKDFCKGRWLRAKIEGKTAVTGEDFDEYLDKHIMRFIHDKIQERAEESVTTVQVRKVRNRRKRTR